MAISIKNDKEIQIMRECGAILAHVLEETSKRAKVGVSTFELDQFAEDLIRQKGGKPAFKGYQGFPGTLCTGVNEVIVHGIPRKDEYLKPKDLLTIDCGVIYKGMYTDAARSLQIGEKTKEVTQLIETAKKALSRAIDKIKPGIHLQEISRTIENTIKSAGYHIIHDLTGHGIGHKLHEDPYVLNYDDGKKGPILKEGMTMAIEPIFSIGTSHMKTLPDDWTLVTVDHSTAVQQEDTILVTSNGAEILTRV